MSEKLTNIHEALHTAVLQDDPPALVTRSIKADALKWGLASEICHANGTDISKWLRECINGLVADYTGKDFQN